MPDQPVETGRGHAIVIGGSIAGLWTARILTNHFDRVTVVERDHFPDAAGPRHGAPQGRHVHILLTRGQRIMEQHFPGLQADLADAGAPSVDWPAECAALYPSGWGPRFRSRLITPTCSRDLLEWSMRRRVAADPRVHFRGGAEVTGLLANPDGTAVQGVRVRLRDQGSHLRAEEELRADLVVDTSGRSSQAPNWLQGLGYPTPKETVVNSFLGYASRWYRPSPTLERDWKALIVYGIPPEDSRGGVIFPVEDGQWIVTVGAARRDYPPTDEEGFLEFTRSFRTPLFYEAIKEAEPLSPIAGYRRTDNRWRHYEQLARQPERFVLLGDAVCAFNPVYGQGMTVAALGALTLDASLCERRRRTHGDLVGLAARFQKELATVIRTPWVLATGADVRWPETEGAKPDRSARLMQSYVDQVGQLAAEDRSATLIFWEVLHLIRPPAALFHPAIVSRLLLRGLKRLALRRPPAVRPAEAGPAPLYA